MAFFGICFYLFAENPKIKELVDESGLTQEDFAKRLDTTPKNLSLLIRGEQSLSIDIAMKLSRMIGTTVNYWLNLQNAYDALIAEFKSEEELEAERKALEEQENAETTEETSAEE